MASFTYFNPSGIDLDLYGLDSLTRSATSFTLSNAAGATILVSGEGFTYGRTLPTGGIITGMMAVDASGLLTVIGSGASAPMQTLINMLTFGAVYGPEAVVGAMNVGRDVLRGSSGSDQLFGGSKADRLLGNDGSDSLFGGSGDDTLTGGKGADYFYFATRGDGNDVIADFTDTGGRQDDRIALKKLAYLSMIVTEDATGVLLTFSTTTSVHVDGWHAADVGRDDFFLL